MVYNIVIDADTYKFKIYDMTKNTDELFDFPGIFAVPSLTSIIFRKSIDNYLKKIKAEVDLFLSKNSNNKIGWIFMCEMGYLENPNRQINLNKVKDTFGANIKYFNKESLILHKLIHKTKLKLNDDDTVWICISLCYYIWQYHENLHGVNCFRLVGTLSSSKKKKIYEISNELCLKDSSKVYVFESSSFDIWDSILTVYGDKAVFVKKATLRNYSIDEFFNDNIPSLSHRKFAIKCDNGIVLNILKLMPIMFGEAEKQTDFLIYNENENEIHNSFSQIAAVKSQIVGHFLMEIMEPFISDTFKAKSLKYLKIKPLPPLHTRRLNVAEKVQVQSTLKTNNCNKRDLRHDSLQNMKISPLPKTGSSPCTSTYHQYEAVPPLLPPRPSTLPRPLPSLPFSPSKRLPHPLADHEEETIPLPQRPSAVPKPLHLQPYPPIKRLPSYPPANHQYETVPLPPRPSTLQRPLPPPPPPPKINIPNDPFQQPQLPTSLSKYTIPPKIVEFKRGINAVGIDLGTSRCCVTVSKTRAFEIVAIENTGERLLPSYISYKEAHEHCGQVVVEQLRHSSSYTVFDVKRIIGKNFEEIDPDPSWPFELVNVNEKIGIRVDTSTGRTMKTPEEVSASLLKYIKQKVDEFQGKVLTEAVITIPATFTDAQKKATIRAAELAGWTAPTLLPEPIAAAFAYFNNHEYTENSIILLFDLGGGTLDICLFKIVSGQINIIKECGNDIIGGRDFDRLLINYFTDRLLKEFNIDVANNQYRKYRLYSECLRIKHNLSVYMEDKLSVADFNPEIDKLIPITRKTFEDEAQHLLFEIRTSITSVFKDTNYRADQISKILLVGGGCRMPMIKNLLKSKFPNASLCCEEQPEEVVTMGAAMYAYHLKTASVNF